MRANLQANAKQEERTEVSVPAGLPSQRQGQTITVLYIINCQNAAKRAAEMGREAPHFVDAAFAILR